MTNQEIANAIKSFADNLDSSITMTDRKESVQYLANILGSESANKIADIFGLTGNYYKT